MTAFRLSGICADFIQDVIWIMFLDIRANLLLSRTYDFFYGLGIRDSVRERLAHPILWTGKPQLFTRKQLSYTTQRAFDRENSTE